MSVMLEDHVRWRWSWESMCGAGGLNIWTLKHHDLGICFQELFLQIPALSLLACISAYYIGRRSGYVIRGSVQIVTINLRAFFVLLMAILPVIEIYINLYSADSKIPVITYFLCAVQCITWLAHFGYTIILKKHLGLSPRGPIFVCVIWTLIFVLTVISVRSHYLNLHNQQVNYCQNLAFGFSISMLLVQIAYGFTLIPGEGTSSYLITTNRSQVIGENQPLINNPYIRFSEEGDPNYLGVAMEDSGWLSKLLFLWVHPLMEKGVQKKLTNIDDLYDLPIQLNSNIISKSLDKALIGNVDLYNQEPQLNRKYNILLIRALHRCFWVQFYSVGILKFISDCAGFAGPLLLNRLVNFIETNTESIVYGYLYAGTLMVTTLIASLCDSHFNFQISIVGLKMRAAIVSVVHKKILTVNEATLKSKFSVGEIINLMSTDTDRIVNSCPSFHAVWSIPLQLVVTLYLLYNQVGISFLAGVIFIIILIPINHLIARKIGKLSTNLMEQKDARIKMLTEILRGIKAIKIYVWEQHFIRVISRLRERELKYLKGRKYLDALCVYFWATTPVLISIFTFGTYTLLGNKLTAATVFTGIALLNMLISPLNAFPWVLNGLTEAWVSVKRVQRLLNLNDLDLDRFYNLPILNSNEIVLKDASFNWGRSISADEHQQLHPKQNERFVKRMGKGKRAIPKIIRENTNDMFTLSRINLQIKKGAFVGIIGQVGAGKSSLLLSILGELHLKSGNIGTNQIGNGFGYVQQQPWLQHGTLRDNILFGKTYDETRYRQVLYACGLSDDILLLPGGDLVGIGDAGTTLSGGQKARIALARAVYQDKSVYLFDDILSAVDANVAKHIFKYCLMGLLKNKTRILATHHVNYLMYCDEIVLMEDGFIKQHGKPADVFGFIDDLLPIDLELEETTITESFHDSLESEKNSDDKDSVLMQEISNVGQVDLNVFKIYLKSMGYGLSLMILLAVTMMQTSRNLTDWWLSFWVTNSQYNNQTNLTQIFYDGGHFGQAEDEDASNLRIFYSQPSPINDTSFYINIYIALVCLNSIFTLFRAFLFAYGGVVAASKIHKLLLKSVLKAKSTFFDITPIGRILNRFSSDTYTIDDSLPFIFNILLAQLFSLLGIVVITVYGMPWVCLILVPLMPLYHWLQHNYRLTSCELKRISTVTLSPIYNHFNETLQGVPTIRAMRAVQRFQRDNEDYIDGNLKAKFASQAAARWLGIRLQFIGVAMIAGVSFVAVLQHQYEGADPGLVGLAMSYALSVTSILNGVVNAFTETEIEMVSMERISQYIKDIPTETGYFIMDPPFGWPNQGVVSFQNVVLKYRENLLPSLRFVTFETRPGEKIAVCGRTGAGKSSLISALFRLIEINSGQISIDSIDISRISLQSLRSRLFCIPQEPFLFTGTLRENLDPLNEFRDNELIDVLIKVNLYGSIINSGGLNAIIGEICNFSTGEKQLLCLARAILHSAKVLCIDEATASIDRDTDRRIQQTLRSAFRKCTVITIAHRVSSILDYDRVLVMHEGQVAEFDQPDILLSNPSSMFYQLVNQDSSNQ